MFSWLHRAVARASTMNRSVNFCDVERGTSSRRDGRASSRVRDRPGPCRRGRARGSARSVSCEGPARAGSSAVVAAGPLRIDDGAIDVVIVAPIPRGPAVELDVRADFDSAVGLAPVRHDHRIGELAKRGLEAACNRSTSRDTSGNFDDGCESDVSIARSSSRLSSSV